MSSWGQTGGEVHILVSITLRCQVHGWSAVYHERARGDRLPAVDRTDPTQWVHWATDALGRRVRRRGRLVVPRDGYYPCTVCRLVIRMRIEARTRPLRAGDEAQGIAPIGDYS